MSLVQALAVALALVAATPALAQFACPGPETLRFQVQRKIVRSEPGFTQGLEFRDGALLESTGSVGGTTKVNRIDPATGRVTRLQDLGLDVFGEGLTVLGSEIFQLTWQDGKVFVRGLDGRLIREMRNEREGWGLANDGANLIFSDGSDQLFPADPRSFATFRAVTLRAGSAPVRNINELEYVGGKIYANVFGDWAILRIDPRSGCVEAFSDLLPLLDAMTPAERAAIEADSNNVLNGIAYQPAADLFFLTGKRWPVIFSGRFRRGG